MIDDALLLAVRLAGRLSGRLLVLFAGLFVFGLVLGLALHAVRSGLPEEPGARTAWRAALAEILGG